jgi:hypothetical protein
MNRISCLIVALAMSKILSAELMPTPGSQPVKPVFDAADVVCSGRVESIRVLEEKKVQSGNGILLLKHVLASVDVQDIYKASGSSPSSILVSFEEQTPVVSAAMPILQKDELAILFLKHSEDAAYMFADRFLGVTSFANIPIEEGGSGLSKLESALAGIVRENNREDKISAMRLLNGMEELQPGTLAQITPLSTSQDPELAFDALAIMIKAGAPGSLEALDQYLQGYQGDGALFALVNIGSELDRRSSREDLPALESLTSSRFLAIRIGSMEAIRNIGELTIAPMLIRRMCDRLSDSDDTIRYIAVSALAEMFHKTGDLKPSMAEFSMSPIFYSSQWQAWCAHEGAGFEKSPSP